MTMVVDNLSDFSSDRKQIVIVNSQISTCENVSASFPQGSILGTMLFLIYTNDLSKLFADDTSLFNVVHDIKTSANELNNDLKKVSN